MQGAMHNKKHILGIVGAVLLALFITLFLPGTAEAAKNVENTYAAVVVTGNDVGDNVSYFGLQYVDTEGYTHVEHVFPHKGGLEESLKFASDNGVYAAENPLDRGKTNTYFFTPAYEVAQITGFDIYCQGAQGSLHAWEVSGLRLYRVDQILDVLTNGSINTVRFNGSQLAYLEERNGNGGVTFSWTGNTLFQLRQDDTSSYRLVFETVPYSMEGDCEYAIRLDIADVNGAGFEQMNQAHNVKRALSDAGFGEYLAIQIEYIDTFGDAKSVTQAVMTSAIRWMTENGVPADAKIAGLAQQGDSIVFNCSLQDMQTVKAVMLYTGKEADALLAQPIAGSESASFTGISIYPEAAVSASISADENAASGPEYFFAADPLFYYTASAPEGETVAADGSHYITMRPYESGAVLTPVVTTEKYLVELIGDPTQILRAPDDVEVQLRYVDMSGSERESDVYSVRSGAKEFYGYWPASAEDFAFTGQINSTSGIRFVMELPQVEHFTGLKISVPFGSGDWQMAGFRVIRLESLSKRICVWETVATAEAASNRRYFRNVEGYTVFSMDEKSLVQPDNSTEIDFVSQSVQKAEDFDWGKYRYAMTYDQCSSNLGLAKIRENYTVEVQVQSGTVSLLDGYGDNGSKNNFYFLLEFENGDSGYVLANQQLSADGFRSGNTESFVVSTNYDYGELVAVHVIPDDISEESDPYDKLNIAQIRVRRNDSGSISKEWVVQNVGWIGIDYRDEGASASIVGQQGRKETEIARIYPVSYSSYALNLEFLIGTGSYDEGSSAFYGTMEGTLEYYNQEGKRSQLTFDVVRAMYDYANKSPIYLDDGTTGSAGSPLAVTDNSFMFRENHTDRFVVSVSDVAKLGKLTLNMKSLNGGSLPITNVTATLVVEAGPLQINEQDEYVRLGKTEYLCEDTVDKIPAFELFLPTGRNIYQEVYFSEHEGIKLDTENSTWISTVSRVPKSKNDTINIFAYPTEDASGIYTLDLRAQYTDTNGVVLETGAVGLTEKTDADGKKFYSALGLTASGMTALNRVYVKAQSAEVVDAYIDHVIVQQVRAGVVVNSFYMDCEHRNADMEFYVLPSKTQVSGGEEQKVYLAFGSETEEANLVAENRDIAVALQYTTVTGGSQVFTSRYIYITDQLYQSIKAGDIVELTFNESYIQNITGILVATSGNVKAQLEMACVDNCYVDAETGASRLLKHFSVPTGAVVQNQTVTLPVSGDTSVEVLEIEFVTPFSDAYLESGTTDPIAMVVGYTDRQGVLRETVVADLRSHVISEGEAFATGSTTQVRLLLRNVASVQSLRLMPYNVDPQITAVWKVGQITVSLGTDGCVQRVMRSVDEYIYENTALTPESVLAGAQVGGLKVSLANIIVTADVSVTNENGSYGTVYRINSAGNKTLSMTVSSGASVKLRAAVVNSGQGYSVKAVQTDGTKDISGSIQKVGEELVLTLPENTSGQDQNYRIAVWSNENENVDVEIEMTVKSGEIVESGDSEKPTDTPDDPADTPDEPADTPDEPADTPDVPTDTPDVPTDTPDVPADTPDVPTDTPDVPTDIPNVPTDTPDVPTDTPDVPTDTPDVPTDTPDVSTDTPDVPTDTPEVPTEP